MTNVDSKNSTIMKLLLISSFLTLVVSGCSSSSDSNNAQSVEPSAEQTYINFNITRTLSKLSGFSLVDGEVFSNASTADSVKAGILKDALAQAISGNSFVAIPLFMPTLDDNGPPQDMIDFLSNSTGQSIVEEAIMQADIAEGDRNVFIMNAGNANNQTLSASYAELVTNASFSDYMLIAGGYHEKNTNGYYYSNGTSDPLVTDDIYFDNCGVTADRCLVVPLATTLVDRAIELEVYLAAEGDDLTDLAKENLEHIIQIHIQGAASGSWFTALGLSYLDAYFNGTLSATEIANRALATGNLDECEEITGTKDASVCGQGTLDLLPALEAIGALGLKFGTSINDFSVPANEFFVSLGKSNLQPVQSALATQSVMLVDEYGAPFVKSLENHIDVASGSASANFFRPGNTYRYSSIEQFSDLISLDNDVSFHQGNLVQNSKGIAFFTDVSLASVNSLRQYESHCFNACLMSDDSMSFITGDLVQASLGNGKSELSFAGCLGDQDLNCAVVGGKVGINDELMIKSSIVATKQEHNNGQVNDQWFGVEVGASLSSSAVSSSESVISKVGVDYRVNDNMNFYVEVEDTTSHWNSLSALSLLNKGAINYQRQFSGVEWFSPSQHLRFQLTKHKVDADENFITMNIPVSRTRSGGIVYEAFDLPLSTIVEEEFSVLYYVNLNKDQKKSTQLSFIIDMPVERRLRVDHQMLKMSFQHNWR